MRYNLAIVAAAGWLIALGCGKTSTLGVSVNAAFRPLIPADTKALAGLEIDKLKISDFYRKHQDQLDIAQVDAISERTGFDVRRDVSEALIAWNGGRALLISGGRFKTPEVEQKLGAMDVRRTSYKQYTFFGGGQDSLAFLSKTLVLAGPTDMLRKAIDQRAADGGGVPEDLNQRLRSIPRADQVWLVSSGPLPVAGIGIRSDVQSALSNIVNYVDGASVGIGLDSGAHLQADISCVSNEGAQRVHDALRGGIGLARLATKDNEIDLLRLWDAVHVDQDHNTVHLRADLPGDLADKLIAYIPKLRGRAGQALNQR